MSQGIGDLEKVSIWNSKFKQYELIYFNPLQCEDRKFLNYYIKGSEKLISNELKRIDNSELLLSVINLGGKIHIKSIIRALNEKNEIEINSLLEDVLAWCKKFGLSNKDDFFYNNYTKDTPTNYAKNIEHPYIAKTGYCAFNLWHFIKSVTNLYELYVLWEAFDMDDMDAIRMHSKRYIVSEHDACYFSTIKEWMVSEMSLHLTNVHTTLEYSEEKKSFDLVPHSEDLIDIAYYQLSLYMTLGMNNIKKCTECNTLFKYDRINGLGYRCSLSCKSNYQARKRMETYYKKKQP